MTEQVNLNVFKFLSIAALLSLMVLLFTFFGTCVYLSPDDFGRQLIANGSLGGSPDPFLYLTSTKIGHIVNALKNMKPAFNWYYAYVVFNYLLFSFFQFLIILTKDKLTKNTLVKLGFLFLLTLLAVMRVESTTIAILMITLSFMYGVQYAQDRKLVYLLVALLLFAYAALIRIDVLFVFAFIYALPLLYLFFKNRCNWETIIIAGLTLLLFFNFRQEQSMISAKVGFDFNQFVKDTERIIDNPNNLDEADLSHTEFNDTTIEVIRNFFFIDQAVFSPEKMHHLAQGIQSTRAFEEVLQNFYMLGQDNALLLFIFVLSLFFIQLKRSRWLYGLLVGLSLSLITYLILFLRLPPKISFALFYALILWRIYFGQFRWHELTYLGLVAILFAGFMFISKVQGSNKLRQDSAGRFINLLNENPELIFQTTRSAQIPFESLTGYKDELANTKLNFLPFGWVVNTPAYYKHLAFLGVNNHFKFLFTDERVRIICEEEDFLALLESYCKVAYQLDLKFVRDTHFENWPIYKIEGQGENM